MKNLLRKNRATLKWELGKYRVWACSALTRLEFPRNFGLILQQAPGPIKKARWTRCANDEVLLADVVNRSRKQIAKFYLAALKIAGALHESRDIVSDTIKTLEFREHRAIRFVGSISNVTSVRSRPFWCNLARARWSHMVGRCTCRPEHARNCFDYFRSARVSGTNENKTAKPRREQCKSDDDVIHGEDASRACV